MVYLFMSKFATSERDCQAIGTLVINVVTMLMTKKHLFLQKVLLVDFYFGIIIQNCEIGGTSLCH